MLDRSLRIWKKLEYPPGAFSAFDFRCFNCFLFMTGVTHKCLFVTVNGFNPKLSALKINSKYLMHIFMGF